MLPIISRVLPYSEIGYIFLFQTLVLLCANIVSCGGINIIQSRYFDINTRELSEYLASATATSFLLWILLLCFVYSFKGIFVDVFNAPATVFLTAVALSFFSVFNSNLLGLYQITEQPKKHFTLYTIQQALILIFSISLLFTYIVDYSARVVGIALGTILVSGISIKLVSKFISSLPKISVMKELASIGWPVVFHSSAMLFIAQSDKFLIAALMGVDSVGLYGVSAQLASIIAFLSGAMVMSYTPVLYRSLASKGQNSGYARRVLLTCLSILLGFSVGYSMLVVVSHDTILGPGFDFQEGAFLVLCLGGLFFGTYHFFTGYFYFFKRTKLLAGITVSVAIINIGASYLLIPYYGLLGAALGSLLSYATACMAVMIFAYYTNSKFA